MRICPECNAVYQGEEKTCTLDGVALVDVPTTDGPGKKPSGFATTAIGPADVRDTPFTPPPIELPPDLGESGDPFVGKVLGGLYKVEQKIGEGGMGAVYVAQHVHMGKRFAVKVLSRAIAKNKSAVERLRQEAVAAGKIEHDNIVDVKNFDVTPEGDVFIVMELLKGQPLADVVAQGPMQLDRVLHLGWQLCSALGAAHEHGIVHRDLKPENVFVLKKGNIDFAKVLDFGISKMKSAEAEQVRMTKTGQLVGTPLYMSPEQAKGEMEVDHRCDIYALGVILYEMLTGTPPFSGNNYFQLLWAHGNEPPQPLRARNPNVYIPEAVEKVILRALAKRREDRFESMAEFADALAAAAPEVPRTSLPSHPSLPSLRPNTPTPSGVQGVEVAATGATTGAIQGSAMKRGVIWAGAAAVLVGVGVTALAVAGGGDPDRPTTVAVRAPPRPDPNGTGSSTPQNPNPTIGPAEPDPDPPPTAEMARVHFESRPAGATVHVSASEGGERVVCDRTPCDVEIERSDTPLSVRFSLARHRDVTRTFRPGTDASVTAELRLARPRDPGGTNGTGLGIKTW